MVSTSPLDSGSALKGRKDRPVGAKETVKIVSVRAARLPSDASAGASSSEWGS